jgi:hypothetical protein
MTFDWKKSPKVTHIHGGPGVKIHTYDDPGHEIRVVDGHWAVGAINDLLQRVRGLEKMGEEARKAIDGAREDEPDELKQKVAKLVVWLRKCHSNWVDDSPGKHQAEYTLAKMYELGLIDPEFFSEVVPE